MVAKPPNGRPLDSKLPAQQQERKPQEFLPPASASAAGDSSSRGTRHSVVGSYDKVSSAKPSTLDEFTDQLDAYTSGRVEELPTRPLSIIGAVRSLGANLASRKHTAVCSGQCVCMSHSGFICVHSCLFVYVCVCVVRVQVYVCVVHV